MRDMERFWQRVQRGEMCWLWIGGQGTSGYGRIWFYGRYELAHRASWLINRGPIPDGLFVCHNCPDGDNPLCVNPAHLFLGTAMQNTHDMIAKGRQKPGDHTGEHAGKAKLTDTLALTIRERYATGTVLLSVLAIEFGVTRASIGKLIRRDTWAHVPPGPLELAGRVAPEGVYEGKPKLTEKEVGAIRARYAAGGVRYQDIAAAYRVHPGTIARIVRHESRA